jgi:predicted nuclease of predicted toxin-antitoxin system
MRFLADENFPGTAVAEFQTRGHDIIWMRVAAPATADVDVLAQAMREQRILLTFDKDFGELAWRNGLSPECGIVLIRVRLRTAIAAAHLVDRILERSDWFGHFSVIEDARVRMRPLPEPPSNLIR